MINLYKLTHLVKILSIGGVTTLTTVSLPVSIIHASVFVGRETHERKRRRGAIRQLNEATRLGKHE